MTGGAERLSDAEVLALVLREGTDSLSARELAGRILEEVGGLASLAGADADRVRRAGGCGTLRAATVVAAFEMARRAFAEGADRVDVVNSREDVARLFGHLSELSHEEFWVLYLTSAGRVIDRVRVSQGGVSGTVVDHRLIVKRALELLAGSLVLVHNHPSGSSEPSADDISATARVKAAAALFDITVVDHVIISKSGSYSLAERGRL